MYLMYDNKGLLKWEFINYVEKMSLDLWELMKKHVIVSLL